MENKFRFGVIDSPPDERDHIVKFDVDRLSAPASFVAKTIPKYPKYQRSNDCVACALSSVLECFLKEQTGSWYTLSSGFIYGNKDYTTNQASGMVIRDALRFVNHDGDVRVQEFDGRQFDYPEIVDYVAANRGWLLPRATPQAIAEYIRADVEIPNEFKLGLAKCQYAIVSIPIFADDSILDGVYVHLSDEIVGRHAVMVYGYNEKGYLMLNSWGKNWGENGHAILPYNHPINEAWYLLPNANLGQFYSDGNDSYKPQIPAYGMQWDDVPNRAFEGEIDTAPEPPKPIEPPVNNLKKVFIGVGHGGKDSGAVGLGGLLEKNLNLAIALSARTELERHGVQVLLSRRKDEDDPLTDEIKECNAFSPDLAIDLHNNAGGGDGYEAYYKLSGGLSKTLALNIEAEVKAIGQNSRGVKTKANSYGTDWFGFVREVKCPSILAEFAFVDTKDVECIDTLPEQNAMGVAAAKGILKTLGIQWVNPAPIVPPVPPTAAKYGVDITAFGGAALTRDKADDFVKVFWDGTAKKGTYCSAVSKGTVHSVVMQPFTKKADAEARAVALRVFGWSAEVKVM